MISYYELLGMIKEDKAPEKIRIHLTPNTSKIYIRHNDIDEEFSYYGLLNEDEENEEYKYYLSECLLESSMFDKNIEIIEEEKKIPEKIEIYVDEKGHYFIDKHCKKIYVGYDEINFMVEEFNQLIEYLQSKGE